MKHLTNKLARFKQLILSIVIYRFCKIGIHNFEFQKGTANKYYECKWCDHRKVIESLYGYQPIDRDWLNCV